MCNFGVAYKAGQFQKKWNCNRKWKWNVFFCSFAQFHFALQQKPLVYVNPMSTSLCSFGVAQKAHLFLKSTTKVSFSRPIVQRKFALQTTPAFAEFLGFLLEDLTSVCWNVQLWCG
jgi:hypothetical protein